MIYTNSRYYYDIYIFPIFKPVAVFSVILGGESLWLALSKSVLFIFVFELVLALKPN